VFETVPRPSFKIFGLSHKRQLNLQLADSLFFWCHESQHFLIKGSLKIGLGTAFENRPLRPLVQPKNCFEKGVFVDSQ
jgi:hypothetical protein